MDREHMARQMQADQAAARSAPSALDRAKVARAADDARRRAGREPPPAIEPKQLSELYGEHALPPRDNPEGAYGVGEQPDLGVQKDRMGTLVSASASSSQERAEREAPAERVGPVSSEVIDPRGLSGS